MQEAKRYIAKKVVTLSIVSNNSMPIFIKINITWLYFICCLLLGVIIFSMLVLRSANFIQNHTQDYKLVKATNSLQRIKLTMAKQKNDTLDQNIHLLKVQEEEIKDLLNINFDKDQSYNVNYYNYPLIYTQHIVSKKGEVGRVIIDDTVVVEYFDNTKNPTAYQRALLTADRLKVFLANKKARR